jgi:hypothetical protein
MRHNNWSNLLRAFYFAGVLAASPSILPGQSSQSTPAPIFSVSANGMTSAQAYQGWALLLDAELSHPNLYSTSTLVTPLLINPQNGSWANTIQLVVTDTSGATRNWPIQLATTPSGSLGLDATSVGRLAWVVAPSDTAAIAPGTYSVNGILNTTASAGVTGWNGTQNSNPVSIQVASAPASQTAQQQEQQFEMLASYHRLVGEASQALVDVNNLLAQQPTSVGGLALQGDLLDQMGQTANALASYDQAFGAFYAANPGVLPEAPEGLLIPQGRLQSELLSQSGARGMPQVAINLLDQGTQSAGVFFVDLRITNVGNDVAENVLLNQFTFQTLSGTGLAMYNNVLSPRLPTFTDFLAVNASATVRIFVAAQGIVNTFSMTESGSTADIFGTDYSFSQTQTVSLNFTGNLGPLTITANSATQAYGQPTPFLSNATYSGFVNGDTPASLAGALSCTTTATQSSPVGTYPINCSGQSSTSYTIAYVPGTLTITADSLTVTANNATRQYGQQNPVLNTVTYNGFVNGDTSSSLGGTLTCTTSGTPASSVGNYVINCSGLTSANYAITFVPGALTITPAPLTIAANNASRPYGANNPAFSASTVGLVNGDPIGAAFATPAVPASPVGPYPIIPTAVGAANVLSNYSIALLNGTLSVVPEITSLSVVLSPNSIPVGQTSTATLTLNAPGMVIPIDPSVLAQITLTSPVASDILSSNGACTPVPGTTPGVASCTVTITSIEPNGRTLNAAFPGSANLASSGATADLIVTSAVLSQQSCIQSDFRNVGIPGGNTIWFNSIFKARDVSKQKFHIWFTNSTVQFRYKDSGNNLVSANLAVPNAQIVIDPSATAASTTFDSVNNVWITTIPWDLDDNSFLTGMSWTVPTVGLPADVEPVTWCGTFSSDVANVDIGWRWAAAAYSSFGSGNNTLGVKPMDTDHDNQGTNDDRAGTPENFKQFVIPGARGKGARNFTGSYTGSAQIE